MIRRKGLKQFTHRSFLLWAPWFESLGLNRLYVMKEQIPWK